VPVNNINHIGGGFGPVHGLGRRAPIKNIGIDPALSMRRMGVQQEVQACKWSNPSASLAHHLLQPPILVFQPSQPARLADL
jgi:hypothetical protein